MIIMLILWSNFSQPTISDTNKSNQTTVSTTTYYANSTTYSSYSTSTTYYPTTTTSTGSPFPNLPSNDLPLGKGSLDFNFVVGNNLTTNNGPTKLSGEAGKTVFYDINVTSFPYKEVLDKFYPGSSSLIESLGTQNSKIFFKILSEKNDYLQFVPGFILGDNILFNTSLIFQTSSPDFGSFLSSLVIPKQLTLTLPNDYLFMKYPTQNQTSPKCYSYSFLYYSYYPYSGSCPAVMPQYMNFYVNPNNFQNLKQELDPIYANMFKNSNSTITSRIDWSSVSSSYIPSNVTRVNSQNCYTYILGTTCSSSSVFYETATVYNSSLSLSMPFMNILSIYRQSDFNFSA